MNKKALLIALASAIAGIVLLQIYMRRFEQQTRGGDLVTVLLARKDIPAGTVITAQHVTEYQIPESYTSGRNVLGADSSHVIGTRVSTTVRANEPLLWTDVARMRQDRSLASMVQPGMVAYSIGGQTFDGLLGPGDRVDVMLVTSHPPGIRIEDGTPRRAVTLLQSTLVLAVGSSMARDGSGHGSVTLLVSPEQAQLLLVSKSEGQLQLILRHPDDVTIREPVSAVTTEDLMDPKRRATFRNAHAPGGDSAKPHN